MESRILNSRIAKQLDISDAAARQALGQLLGFVTQHADAGIAKSFLAQIPWAHELIGRVRVPPLTEAAVARMREQIAVMGNQDLRDIVTGLGLFGALRRSGLTDPQIGQLLDIFLAFVAELAGETLARRMLSNVPDLDPLAAWPRQPASTGRKDACPSDCLQDRS